MGCKQWMAPQGIHSKTIFGVGTDSAPAGAVGVSFGADSRLMRLNRGTKTFHPGFDACDLLEMFPSAKLWLAEALKRL